MILKDLIKYYEVNGCDFINDLEDFGELQRGFINGLVDNGFTEKFEEFTDKLAKLWIETHDEELPKQFELIDIYCKTIKPVEKKKNEEVVFLKKSSSLRKSKGVRSNQTLKLLTFFANNEIPFNQFLDIELEVVLDVIKLLSEEKKKQQEKQKRR